jgi:hypothetical protein
MNMHTYVNFAGRCAEAFRFYEKHLGGTIGMMMTHGQAPEGRRSARAHFHRRHRTDGGRHSQRAADAKRVLVARRRQRCRSRTDFFGTGGRWRRIHADTGDVFRQSIRPASRPVRHQLDDHARTADASAWVTQTTSPIRALLPRLLPCTRSSCAFRETATDPRNRSARRQARGRSQP